MTEAEKHDTVLDTGAEQLGKTYAQALIGAANNAGVADQVIEQLNQLVDEYLAGNPSLQAAFSSPRVDEAEKVRVIERLFGNYQQGRSFLRVDAHIVEHLNRFFESSGNFSSLVGNTLTL